MYPLPSRLNTSHPTWLHWPLSNLTCIWPRSRREFGSSRLRAGSHRTRSLAWHGLPPAALQAASLCSVTSLRVTRARARARARPARGRAEGRACPPSEDSAEVYHVTM